MNNSVQYPKYIPTVIFDTFTPVLRCQNTWERLPPSIDPYLYDSEMFTVVSEIGVDIQLLTRMVNTNETVVSFNWMENIRSIRSLPNQHKTKELISNENQKNKNEAAIALLEKWFMDDSGYDDAIWENLKDRIEENRLSDKKRFNE